MKIIEVVCGIIWNDGRVFIARRMPEKSMGGYWEFPGGKIEGNEDPETALKRELDEELGMKVNIKSYLSSHIHHYDSFTIKLKAYECEFVSSNFNLTDHDECCFVLPENLNKFNFASADLFFIDLINKI